MAVDPSHPTPRETTGGNQDGRPEKPGYGRLARRISTVTTNCLLTAIVLVAGWAFGRQVLRWWAADPTQQGAAARTAGDLDGLGDPTRRHEVQFGDLSWSLCRESISGDKQMAMAALRASCREIVRDERRPGDAPGAAEGELLSRLAGREPVERESGKWHLYEFDEAFPMVVGTRPGSGPADSMAGKTADGGDRCVVTWGLAIPAGTNAWTLCTFQAVPGGEGSSVVLADIPIPPGCSRKLAVRVASSGATVTFEGPQRPKTWIEFYEEWFRVHNWDAAGEWRRSGNRFSGRYCSPENSRIASVDLHFGPKAPGGAAGLLVITPVRPPNEE